MVCANGGQVVWNFGAVCVCGAMCAALCVDRWFDVIVSLLDGIAEVLGKAVRIGGDVMEWREAVR